ncbi:hypothetical protein HMI56_001388 [Coelomomyces lativittatus]|nr:hypothetical protein HMI56_001388 [Coelomomyces lativittatus]
MSAEASSSSLLSSTPALIVTSPQVMLQRVEPYLCFSYASSSIGTPPPPPPPPSRTRVDLKVEVNQIKHYEPIIKDNAQLLRLQHKKKILRHVPLPVNFFDYPLPVWQDQLTSAVVFALLSDHGQTLVHQNNENMEEFRLQIPEPSLAPESTLISPLTTIVDQVTLSTSSIPSNQSTTESLQPCSTSSITPTLDPLSLTPLVKSPASILA